MLHGKESPFVCDSAQSPLLIPDRYSEAKFGNFSETMFAIVCTMFTSICMRGLLLPAFELLFSLLVSLQAGKFRV